MKVIPAPTRMARYPVTQAKGKGKSGMQRIRDVSQSFWGRHGLEAQLASPQDPGGTAGPEVEVV